MLTLLVYNFRKEYISAMYFYSAIIFINEIPSCVLLLNTCRFIHEYFYYCFWLVVIIQTIVVESFINVINVGMLHNSFNNSSLLLLI